jgi:nicotinic acid mononucleotide adenylyltransferase
MSPEEIRAHLERLDRSRRFRTVRFDGRGPMTGRIAVLSSAFNPPTLGHLAMLDSARDVAAIGSVAAMLTTRNVAKDIHGAPLEHRIGMLLVEVPRSRFAVLACNAARFVDQAAALVASAPASEFDFIVGYDTLIRLFDTRYYGEGAMERELEAFFAAHRLIAINRDEFGPEAIAAFLERPSVRPFAPRVIVAEIGREEAGHSSSASREALAAGADAPIAESVRAYIRRHRLYPGTSAGD